MYSYYDHRLPESFLKLLRNEGELHWLVEFTKKYKCCRLGFKKDEDKRENGAVQLYIGTHNVLEIHGPVRGRLRVTASSKYQKLSPFLFGMHMVRNLHKLNAEFLKYLQDCLKEYGTKLTHSEALLTNFIRKYGMSRTASEQFAAVDSNVQVYYRDKGLVSYIELAKQVVVDLKEMLKPPQGEKIPTMNSGIGVFSDGTVGIVELIRDDDDGVKPALRRLAAFRYKLALVMEQGDADLNEVLTGIFEQKKELGLVASDLKVSVSDPAIIQPVIAGMSDRDDWLEQWLNEGTKIIVNQIRLLRGMRFWRLDKDGKILEERVINIET